MACRTPIKIPNPHYRKKSILDNSKEYIKYDENEYTYVPCGGCDKCLTARSNSWFIRLKAMQKESIRSNFVTLTYSPIALPYSPSGRPNGVKKHLQDYFKRLRKLQVSDTIKYYACLEYGETDGYTHRPHYHIICFNVEDERNFQKAWSHYDRKESIYKPYGRADVRPLLDERIKYVTGYISKKTTDKNDKSDDRLSEFSHMSKKMGQHILKTQAKYSLRNMDGSIMQDGIIYPLPRYYKDKIFNEDQRKEIAANNKHASLIAVDKYVKTHFGGNYDAYKANQLNYSIIKNTK